MLGAYSLVCYKARPDPLTLTQRKLAAVEYPNITRKPTVSIGICEVRPDCPLTNGEIYARAEAAKDKAKNERKGSIATYRDGMSEMYLVDDVD